MDRLQQAIDAIDHVNRQDPHNVEFPYSEQVSRWVLTLNRQASEFLRIAARGQHIARWTIPRASYPMDRGGYLRWREALKIVHAQKVGEIMQQTGYSPTDIERVRLLILKKNIKGDAETQTLEDALCLVFLETQFKEFSTKVADEKLPEIVRKTWRKMSAQGQAEALKLPWGADEMAYLKKVLSGV